jgi:hypothetical protein
MTLKKETRGKYVIYDFSFWRFKVSSFRLGKKWDIRISIRLGEEW